MNQEKGTVIILAIVIITAVIAAASIFGNLIVKEIRQSRLIDQSIQAYYLAESGAERALHQTRIREAVPDCQEIEKGTCIEASGRCSVDLDIPCITNNKGSLGSVVEGNWSVDVSNENQTQFLLEKGKTFQIDLFSPQQVKDANINEIQVLSELSGLTLFGELINMTNILNISGAANCQNVVAVVKDQVDTPKRFYSLDGKDIVPECSYAFRLSYPFSSVGNQSVIAVSIYNTSGEQMDIPSRLIINSSAQYGRSQQTITIRTPIRPPLSGLYDFVLFSEEEVVK